MHPPTHNMTMNFQSPKAQANHHLRRTNLFSYESPLATIKAGSPVNGGQMASPNSFDKSLKTLNTPADYLLSPSNFDAGIYNQNTLLETPPTRKESQRNGSTERDNAQGSQHTNPRSFDDQLTPQKVSGNFNELMTPPRHSN